MHARRTAFDHADLEFPYFLSFTGRPTALPSKIAATLLVALSLDSGQRAIYRSYAG